MGPLALAGIQAGAGLLQGIIGGIGARKARRKLEGLQTPTYAPVKSITDYYNEANRRYQENPYQSNLYKMQAQNIERGTQQGISALQDRRSALAGISGLVQGQSDAYLKAGAMAEGQRDQRFNQLVDATNAMAGEQRKAWEINQMLPFQRKSDLLSQKAAGYTQLMNAGLQNAFGGLQTGIMAKGMGGSTAPAGANEDYGAYEFGNLNPSTYKVPLASYGG
jgi:hypothetical protein